MVSLRSLALNRHPPRRFLAAGRELNNSPEIQFLQRQFDLVAPQGPLLA